MRFIIRTLLVLGGVAMIGLAAGFFLQMEWAISLWPWQDGPFSLRFVAAMQAAIAAAMLWVGITGEMSVLAAGAVNLIVQMTGCAFYFFQLSGQPERAALPTGANLTMYAIACTAFAVFNLGLLIWAIGIPMRDKRPLPGMVRFAFVIFAAILLGVGVALLGKPEVIFPWQLNPDSSVLFGWMFIGDAFYFLYALVFPAWRNAAAQLWSFLAYDLVLIGPFLLHFGAVKPEHRNSLIGYTFVLVFSAAVAIYYLFINQRTRIGSEAER